MAALFANRREIVSSDHSAMTDRIELLSAFLQDRETLIFLERGIERLCVKAPALAEAILTAPWVTLLMGFNAGFAAQAAVAMLPAIFSAGMFGIGKVISSVALGSAVRDLSQTSLGLPKFASRVVDGFTYYLYSNDAELVESEAEIYRLIEARLTDQSDPQAKRVEMFLDGVALRFEQYLLKKHGSIEKSLLGPSEAKRMAEALRSVVRDELTSVMRSQSASPPSKLSAPPSLWVENKAPGDNPIAFIRRHYGEWIGRGLTRADIRQLDPSLYVALQNWLRGNSLPPDIDLPTRKVMNDRMLARLNAESMPMPILAELVGGDARQLERLGAAQRYRERKGRAVNGD